MKKQERADLVAGEAFEAHLAEACCPYAAAKTLMGERTALAYEKRISPRTLNRAVIALVARVLTVNGYERHVAHQPPVDAVNTLHEAARLEAIYQTNYANLMTRGDYLRQIGAR